ncbi:MAG: hypothetical protein K2K56_10250 [Lachnospiraceae bacterium]|nr:hypothetical protein [Lachnospiraceae bacterium]
MIKFWKKHHNSSSEPDSEVLEMDLSQLISLYKSFFAVDNKKKKQAVMSRIAQALSNFDIKKMIQVDNHFREDADYYFYSQISWDKMYTAREEYSYLTDREYYYFVVLGSFHPNGYFRQKCLKSMKKVEGTFPYFILRMNDWVEAVRQEAYQGALIRVDSAQPAELFQSLPAVLKVKNSRRRSDRHLQDIEEAITKRLKEYIPEMDLNEITSYSLPVRNAFCRFICRHEVLDRTKMETVMQNEKSIFAKRILIRAIIGRFGLQEADYNRYIRDKSSAVRRHAAEMWYSVKKDIWSGAEELLMDECKAVRELARFMIGKHTEISIVDFYLAELEKRESYIAVLGIGENGDKDHAQYVMPYLQSRQPKVVKAALLSLSNLLKEEGAALYAQYLQADEPALIKIAFIGSRKWGVHHGVDFLKQLFLQSDNPNAKRYALLLLVREPGWKKVSCLLDLLEIKEEPYHSIIWRGIWVKSMYCSASNELADEIEQKIECHRKEFSQYEYETIKLELKCARK